MSSVGPREDYNIRADVYRRHDTLKCYHSLSGRCSNGFTINNSSNHMGLVPSISPDVSTGNLLSSRSRSTISPDGKQLLFFYDCETTGLSYHCERIIEIASAVIVPANVSITKTEFSSLCYTSHRINPKGKKFMHSNNYIQAAILSFTF